MALDLWKGRWNGGWVGRGARVRTGVRVRAGTGSRASLRAGVRATEKKLHHRGCTNIDSWIEVLFEKHETPRKCMYMCR